MKPLSREVLLQHGKCCGNGCRNCPYLPRHIRGSTEFVTMIQCYVCGGDLMEMRTKLVCSRCFTINETCCDGGQCHTTDTPDIDKSPNYQESDNTAF